MIKNCVLLIYFKFKIAGVQNNLVSTSVTKFIIDADEKTPLPSGLIKVVSGILDVSEFLNDKQGNVLFETTGDRFSYSVPPFFFF